jgi:hypothetical protein
MIDVKEAARIAAEYFAGLYDASTYSDLQLEEVALTDDEKYWLITLSYGYGEPTEVSKLLNLPGGRPRKFKQFKLDAETGKVQSMTIRELKAV